MRKKKESGAHAEFLAVLGDGEAAKALSLLQDTPYHLEEAEELARR